MSPVSRRLTAYIEGICGSEDVGRNLPLPMLLASLSAPPQPFPSPKLAARAVCRTVGVSIVRKSARRAPAKMCHLMVLKPPDSPAPQAPPARPPIDCPWPVPCRPRPAETQAIGAILDSRSAENKTKKRETQYLVLCQARPAAQPRTADGDCG